MPVLGGSFTWKAKLLNGKNVCLYLPEWSTAKSESKAVVPFESWSKYIKVCVERYKGKITHWEIMNEPNLIISAEQYIPYLKVAYETIKSVDPSAKVVGFCSTGDMGGGIIKFLRKCFELGGLNYCDIVSFHSYSAALDWSSPVSAEKMITEIKSLMKEYNADTKELWHTELFILASQQNMTGIFNVI